MRTRTWTAAEAKAKFSEFLDKANSEGPQKMMKHRRATVVVVGAKDCERKAERTGNLAEFLASSPLRGSGLKIRRLPMLLRNLNCEFSFGLECTYRRIRSTPLSELIGLKSRAGRAVRKSGRIVTFMDVYIIAGPNGVGKTTFARRFLPKYANCKNFVNADLIAQGLAPFSPEAAAIRA